MKKGKDPAFPFYTKDFLSGVMNLEMREVGQYIVMLCYQWEHKVIPKKRLGLIIGQEWDDLSSELRDKFVDNGATFTNERIEIEREKRSNFKRKQSLNGQKGGRPKNPNDNQKKPLENENENEDVNASVNVKANAKIHVEVIEHLNLGAGRKTQVVKTNTDFIDKQLKQGATVDDLKDVIEYQCAEWIGTEYEKFLRPSTLFGNKYQNYIENVRFNKSKGVSAKDIWRKRSDKPHSEADSNHSILEAVAKHRAANGLT